MTTDSIEKADTGALIKEVLQDTRELVRIEVKLAKDEAQTELRELLHAVVAFGVAAACAVVTLSLLAVALVLALGGRPTAALGVAAGFLVVTLAAGLVGYASLPKDPLARTRQRLESDVQQLKEHVA